MKPMLTAAGTERLKVWNRAIDKLLLSFALNFSLRCYYRVRAGAGELPGDARRHHSV